MINKYVSLTKPGIIRGNLITATAGFFLAAQGAVDWSLLAAMISGLALIIAAACVFNNYLDRGIDLKMERTRHRALANGEVSGGAATLFGLVLALSGAAILGIFTNLLTVGLSLLGLFAYVIIYGIGKRRSVHGTVIGSISGAMPPVVGYTAVSNHVDAAAIILFFILIFWQMPHFYAISIYRAKEYAAAGIPVLPLENGLRNTKIQILCYITGFTITASLLTIYGYTSVTYLAVALVLGLSWFVLGLRGFGSFRENTAQNTRWSRNMFLYSLIVITLLCTSIIIDSLTIY